MKKLILFFYILLALQSTAQIVSVDSVIIKHPKTSAYYEILLATEDKQHFLLTDYDSGEIFYFDENGTLVHTGKYPYEVKDKNDIYYTGEMKVESIGKMFMNPHLYTYFHIEDTIILKRFILNKKEMENIYVRSMRYNGENYSAEFSTYYLKFRGRNYTKRSLRKKISHPFITIFNEEGQVTHRFGEWKDIYKNNFLNYLFYSNYDYDSQNKYFYVGQGATHEIDIYDAEKGLIKTFGTKGKYTTDKKPESVRDSWESSILYKQNMIKNNTYDMIKIDVENNIILRRYFVAEKSEWEYPADAFEKEKKRIKRKNSLVRAILGLGKGQGCLLPNENRLKQGEELRNKDTYIQIYDLESLELIADFKLYDKTIWPLFYKNGILYCSGIYDNKNNFTLYKFRLDIKN